MTNPASSHLLSKSASDRSRNLVFSIKQTGVPLGGIAAGLMTPPLTVAYGWPVAFGVAAVATFSVIAALQPLRLAWDSDRDPGIRLMGSPLYDLRFV